MNGVAVLVSVAFLGLPALAQAQTELQPQPPAPPPPPISFTGPGTFTHDGFYLRFELGFGAFGASGTGPSGSASTGGAAEDLVLAIGGTPVEGFVVGGLIGGLATSSPPSGTIPSNATSMGELILGPFVDWFPNARGGWHVGGALGLGGLSVDRYGADNLSSLSLGGRAFGGYDFWIGPQWSLGITAAIQFVTRGNLTDSSQNDAPSGYSMGALGGAISVTLLYH
jgi:hypothetical protein